MDGSLASRHHRGSWIVLALGPACWFGALLTDSALQSVTCQRFGWLPACVCAAFTIPLALSLCLTARGLSVRRGEGALSRFIDVASVLMPAVFSIALLWMLVATISFPVCS